MIKESRTVIVNDVELFYVKMDADKPVEPFGQLQWELQMRTRDKEVAKSWKEDFYLTPKTDEDEKGIFYRVNVKKKAIKKDGTKADCPEAVDKNKQELDATTIGNESRGNVKLFQYPYDVAGRQGVATMLSAVQVTEYKKYTPKNGGTDFDIIGDDSEPVIAGESAVDF